MITLCGRAQNVNNEAFLWKTAVLGREKPPVCAGTSCPWPILVFYIPPCRKTFTAWRNVKYLRGRGKECSRTNRSLFLSQNCNFPEESFILISFCYSVGCEYTYSGPFREAQISVQPLWGFSSSNPDCSQSRAEQLQNISFFE